MFAKINRFEYLRIFVIGRTQFTLFLALIGVSKSGVNFLDAG